MFTVEECKLIRGLGDVSKPSTTLFSDPKINYNYYVLKDRWILERISDYLKPSFPDNKVADMEEIYMHRYFVGGEFKRHSDKIKYPDHLLNVGVCLNDNYIGGEFMLYDPDKQLPKKTGVNYSYPSHIEHEVKRITAGERWSLNLFLKHEHLFESKDIL